MLEVARFETRTALATPVGRELFFGVDGGGFLCRKSGGIKKRLTVSRQPILINLKSNTMKNTQQR